MRDSRTQNPLCLWIPSAFVAFLSVFFWRILISLCVWYHQPRSAVLRCAVKLGPRTPKANFFLEVHPKSMLEPGFWLYVGCDWQVILNSGMDLHPMQRHFDLSTETWNSSSFETPLYSLATFSQAQGSKVSSIKCPWQESRYQDFQQGLLLWLLSRRHVSMAGKATNSPLKDLDLVRGVKKRNATNRLYIGSCPKLSCVAFSGLHLPNLGEAMRVSWSRGGIGARLAKPQVEKALQLPCLHVSICMLTWSCPYWQSAY